VRSGLLQRKCACGGTAGSGGECAECKEKKLQRKSRGSGLENHNESFAPPIVHDVLRSRGEPLDTATRAFMEPRFAHDFSAVRLHTDSRAAESAGAVGASAYTVGSHIVFNAGRYSAGSSGSARLLAHELTHVVQQNQLTVPAAGKLAIASPDGPAETQAENVAGQISSGSAGGVGRIDRAVLQRQPFEPWPGQTGTDVSGTRRQNNAIISERVQRTGDPNYSQLMPILLEFDSSRCTLTSTMEINFVPASDAGARLSTDRFDRLKSKILSIANERLNGWVHIQVKNAAACDVCNGKNISVQVVAREGSSSDASVVELRSDTGRSSAGRIYGGGDNFLDNLFGGVSSSTLWHESGHIVLGLPDEYPPAPGDPPRPANRINTGDWSVMSDSDTFGRRSVMHPRHFSFMTAWLGRRFPNCTFDLVAESPPVVVDVVSGLSMSGAAVGSQWGLDVGADLAVGFSLDRQRRWRALIGAYGSMWLPLSLPERQAFFLGGLVGIDVSTNRSSGGFSARADLRAGAATFTGDVPDPNNFVPTLGGTLSLGYAGPLFEVGAIGGVSRFLSGSQRDNPYFLLGLRAGVTF
jgi:hypothetical protein